jgi:3-oxoisoapionate decarboxylase
MRLGLGSYACTWQIGVPGQLPAQPMTADGLIDRARELGLRLVQIDDNLPLDDWSETALAALRRKAAAADVVIEIGTRGSQPERLREYLRIAQVLGSPLVRTVLDRGDDRPSTAEVLARLAAVTEAYRQAPVRLAIENHDRLPAVELADLVQRGGRDWLGICLDTVNSLGAGEGTATVTDCLMPLAINLHLKDFVVIRAGHQMGFTVAGCAAGDGLLNVQRLLTAANRLRFAGNAILELWTPPGPDLAATIATERTWAERSINHLRPLIPD